MRLPLPIYSVAVFFAVMAAGSGRAYIAAFDAPDWSSDVWILFWALLDLTVAAGLLMRWRLAYILFMAHVAMVIVFGSVTLVLLVVAAALSGIETQSVWIAIANAIFVITCGFIYRYFRRDKISALYFPTEIE
jgi:hypothetical protein